MASQTANPADTAEKTSRATAPTASSAHARATMRANRSDSGLERALRSALHARGLRFRKHYQPVVGLRCRPDVVFTRARLAIFVDGCFWHSCPEHRTQPATNEAWWREKLDANVARDRRHDAALTAAGWHVLRLWEHQPLGEMVAAVIVSLAVARAGRTDEA